MRKVISRPPSLEEPLLYLIGQLGLQRPITGFRRRASSISA